MTNISYVTSRVPEEPVELCTRDDDNKLGANLSYIYYFMFVFSVITNLLVLVIIYRFERLTTVINILLLNLVASSLILMSSLPFQAVYMQKSEWIFGSAMCKIVFSVYYLGFYSSVFFLTLLTIDRYVSVVFSLTSTNVRNQRYAVISSAVVWVISGLACIRPMILHGTYRHWGTEYCEEFAHIDGMNVEKLKKSGFYIQLCVFLILPLAIIIFCYARIVITVKKSRLASKFHAVRVIFMIVVLFFICWIPFNIVELLHYEFESLLSCEAKKKLGSALHVTRNKAYIYFCISPMFYTFMERKFQEHFKQLLVKCFPGLKKPILVNKDNTTAIPTVGTEYSDGKQSESFLNTPENALKTLVSTESTEGVNTGGRLSC
ncbi:C-C chemokine receptor type 3-like [Xiphophorus maculatus]|uniref:C-C chemokine receptor type 3-like n=1 Tax=Xiphophorus maculatus TaxID=8083 RepID=A0A3B5R682_XIPMA|nr:C-C chemokine receptor type 3-like [Xiphophorus maculatus]XP_023181841.1 C-C chemokine receptor type 3-like [Xiphophorus maculatus]